MKHMTAVINNLCFKNSANKKILGKKGFVKICVNVHKRWAADGFNADTCQQSLKSLGNLSGYPNNAVRVVQAKFVKNAKKFMEENLEKD